MFKPATTYLLATVLVSANPFPIPALAADETLIVGLGSEPTTLDPATGISGPEYTYLYSLYDRLVDFEPKTLTLRPGLAMEWAFKGDRNQDFEIRLRKDVKFHDGTTMDAQAVKESLEHVKEANRIRDLDPVTSIEATDSHTVVLHLDRPYSPLPSVLADRAGMIVSPTALKKFGKDFSRNPVGTGPFKLQSWKTGSSLVMTKFSDYWNTGEAKLGKIDYRIIANPTSLVTAAQSGQLTIALGLDPISVPMLQNNPKYRLEIEPSLGFHELELNAALPPLNDPRVRQALNMSVDRIALSNAIFGKIGEGPALMPVPSNYWPYTASLADFYKYDPEKAKALLAQAGHPAGIDLDVCASTTSNIAGSPATGVQLVDILREQMRPAGIRLRAVIVPGSACLETLYVKKSTSAGIMGWSGRPSPYLTYQQNFGSTGPYNIGRVSYPNVDLILEKIVSTYSQEEQKPLFDDLNKAVLEAAPKVPLYFWTIINAYDKRLAGDQPNLLGKTNLTTLYFK
jgi:peptide/nickel transport system substrate-binding protein